MLTVELVRAADQRRRWHELGRVLFADEPRWAPPLVTYERWLFARRHPWLRSGAEVARFLVRRNGRVVGRIAGHHRAGDEDVWFGGFECDDDAPAVGALVVAVAEWTADLGATRVIGPALYTPSDGDSGVLVSGFEHRGGTGRPWHPPWYEQHLATADMVPIGDPMPRWRLATMPASSSLRQGGATPPHASRLADPALVLEGNGGVIAAVPDVSGLARRSTLRRPSAPTEAAVVRCEGDPALLVPGLLAAAHAAGYAHVWTPWSPLDEPPATVHRLVGQNLR